MARSDDERFDLYEGTGGSSLRMVILRGAGVPARERATDWKLISRRSLPVIEFPERELEARGYFVFKLV
jgi:hypothetical protein